MTKLLQEDLEIAFLKALNGDMAELESLSNSKNFATRCQVYITSIHATLQQALYKIFKPVEALLGIDAFQELCYRYSEKNLSKHFNLSLYGQDFHSFAASSPYAGDLPYLEDFVEFCYLWHHTFLDQQSEIVQIESEFPLYEIWERCQPEYTGDKKVINWTGPFFYIMSHDNGKVLVVPVNISLT